MNYKEHLKPLRTPREENIFLNIREILNNRGLSVSKEVLLKFSQYNMLNATAFNDTGEYILYYPILYQYTKDGTLFRILIIHNYNMFHERFACTLLTIPLYDNEYIDLKYYNDINKAIIPDLDTKNLSIQIP